MTDESEHAEDVRPVSVEQARADLAATVAAIEDKLNVPKRTRRAVARAREKVDDLRDENPAALAAIAAGAAAAIAGSVWLSIRLLRK